MPSAPLPPNESRRLAALYEYDVLDTLPEQDFDDITELTSVICDTPISLIGFIDRTRQWYKSSIGMNSTETPRDLTFCAYALLQPDMLVVRDARQDGRFSDHPFVTGDPHIRFYAGAPLISPSGYALGTLCVVDFKPRTLEEDKLSALQALARQVVAQLELRRQIHERGMAERALQKAHQELEQRVEERTRELAAANAALRTEAETRRQAQEQLLQAQKLESVGRLAGGVAHDFNNLLTVISGYTELVTEQLPVDMPARNDLHQVQIATERAAGLTRQLLTFARKQMVQPRAVDLNLLLRDLDKMLHRLLSEDIQLTTRTADRLDTVMADPGQVEQVIVNLAVNARDAMPDGGQLTIATSNIVLNAKDVRLHPDLTPGDWVLISVSDTGMGMDESTQKRAFEPFFTTKEQGKGTGLGLATCYGIIKQAGGHISLYSEPGRGTTFKIYLPAVREAVVKEGEKSSTLCPGGSETILLVEDDPSVLALGTAMLRKRGYTVLEASNGETALQAVREYEGKIHLLLTDVVMPQMGGKELVNRLKKELPEIKVLYTSGYTDDAIVRHGVLESGVAFLQKPFTTTSLSQLVRTTLDSE